MSERWYIILADTVSGCGAPGAERNGTGAESRGAEEAVMPKGSKELEEARREEIVDACERLYSEMSYGEVTIKEIGAATTFTRTSIYNYFATKEEIFLALFAREYKRWGDSLAALAASGGSGEEAFAEGIARSLEERPNMLKLLAMNMYDIEGNSRQERLVEFKRTYKRSIDEMKRCYAAFFPSRSAESAEEFVKEFFPFTFGIYPYTAVTAKQRAAMDAVGMDVSLPTVCELTRGVVLKLLRG